MRRDISATSNDWRATQTGAIRERGEEEDVGVRVADANVLSCDVEAQGYARDLNTVAAEIKCEMPTARFRSEVEKHELDGQLYLSR